MYKDFARRTLHSSVGSCNWPISASDGNEVIVPSFAGMSSASVSNCSEPRLPFQQAVTPTSVCTRSSLACELPFARPMQQQPICGTMLSNSIFAHVRCSLDVLDKLFLGQPRDTDHPFDHPPCCGRQLPCHLLGRGPCPASI